MPEKNNNLSSFLATSSQLHSSGNIIIFVTRFGVVSIMMVPCRTNRKLLLLWFSCLSSVVSHDHVSAFSTHEPKAFHYRNMEKRSIMRKLTTTTTTTTNSQQVDVTEFPTPKKKISPALWELAAVGGFATMVGDVAVHPVDCIKTLQQSDIGMNLNFLQAIQSIWQTYGITGFYAGIGVAMPSDVVAGCIKFSVYEILKKWSHENISDPRLALFLCAAVAFVASSVVLVPGELIKQTLQMGHYDTIVNAVIGIRANEGILGFFRGYGGVLFRDIPYTMLELGLYDNFKRIVKKNLASETGGDQSLKPWQEVIVAAIVGAICGIGTAPMDNIKTKVMLGNYSGFVACLMSTVQEHGLGSIFAGAGARAAWLVPFTAIYLPAYDMLKRQIVAFRSENDLGDDDGDRVEELLERM